MRSLFLRLFYCLFAVNAIGCHAPSTQRSAALQREIDAVAQHFQDYDDDFEGQFLAARPHDDPVDLITRAMLGKAAALHELFTLSREGLDGAGSQTYAAWLGKVLHAAGDVRFGVQLARETAEVQDAVRGYLCYDLGIPDWFGHNEAKYRYPVTFTKDSLVFVLDAIDGDPWKGGGFAQRLATDTSLLDGSEASGKLQFVDLEWVRLPLQRQEVYAFSYDWEKDWWGSWAVVGVDSGKIAWQAGIDVENSIKDEWGNVEPGTQSIDSVRVVLLEGQANPFIEVIGTTHMGHGSIYLYELSNRKLRLVLTTKARDCHQDRDLIEGCNLKREYKDLNGDGYTDLRLHGVGLLFDDEKDDKVTRKVLLEKNYYWSSDKRHFVTDQTKWKWFEHK